jgi:hypothetical protein
MRRSKPFIDSDEWPVKIRCPKCRDEWWDKFTFAYECVCCGFMWEIEEEGC